MVCRQKSRIGVVAVFAMIWSTGAFSEEGRPLTAADLAGRKICWDGGYWDKFAANGQHLWGFGATDQTTPGHPDTWSVPQPGVIHTGRKYRQTEVLPDGKYQVSRIGGHGQRRDYWGAVCD